MSGPTAASGPLARSAAPEAPPSHRPVQHRGEPRLHGLGGSIAFSLLGLLIGRLVDVQVAEPAQAVVQMLMGFGGGLFFPLSTMPAALQAIGKTLPSYCLATAAATRVDSSVQSSSRPRSGMAAQARDMVDRP